MYHIFPYSSYIYEAFINMEDLENDAKLAILLQEEERNAITVNDSLIAAFYQQEIDKSNSLKNETSYVAQPIVRETTQIHIDTALAQTIQVRTSN